MNLLLIGSGGREHAMLWAIAKSPLIDKIFVHPGNAGMVTLANIVTTDLSSHEKVIDFCHKQNIELVVIGPEAPLVEGLVDDLDKAGIKAFGPSKKAAQLESSKEFTKLICDKYNIATAAYAAFSDSSKAKEYLKQTGFPIVIKADGLAAGKGVVIAQNLQEATDAIDDMMVNKKFGHAGDLVVIEEFLDGEELSFFAIADGKNVIPFGSAQDHKRVGDGDTGPNTGGMGTYSPAPVLTPSLHSQIMQDIIKPVIDGMQQESIPYRGILFAGLMITKDGPKLLEINTRFGDPETQVLMARLESDLVQLMLDAVDGKLAGQQVKLSPDAAVCVVMAAKGYPEQYEKGTLIKHLEQAAKLPCVNIFHAGTKLNNQGQLTANGGRVLGITATAPTVKEAKDRTYLAVDKIIWPEGFCRRDIGWRAIERERNNDY